MTKKNQHWTRRNLLQTTAATGAALTLSGKAPVYAQSKGPYDGETINVSSFSGPYPKMLASYIPEFTEMTGINVNYETPGFPVYNQRADLELSIQGSAYDVLNVTFIYTARWIGAGWFTPLEEFLDDPNKTPEDFNPGDFLEGTLTPMRNKDGQLFGIPWIADAMMATATRFDLMQQEGLTMPETFDDIVNICEVMHNKEPGLAGFINENHHGWTFPPYLQAFGGDVFVDAPDNLMPTLDSAEAIEAQKAYELSEAIGVLKAAPAARFDESVEIAINLGVDPKHADQMVRGALVLPHGTGKGVRVLVFAKGDKEKEASEAGADYVGAEDLAKKIQQEGWLEFDRVIASPDMMSVVGRLGKVLGPRGLMPNPKLGTVTADVGRAVRDQKAGKVEYRVDKNGIVHCAVAKVSFDAEKIAANATALIQAVIKAKPAAAKGTYLKKIALSTTMGPGIRVDPASVQKAA